MSFSQWLLSHKKPGESMSGFASRIGIANMTLKGLTEQKEHPTTPRLETMQKLAAGLNVSLDVIWEHVKANGRKGASNDE